MTPMRAPPLPLGLGLLGLLLGMVEPVEMTAAQPQQQPPQPVVLTVWTGSSQNGTADGAPGALPIFRS